MDMYFAQYMQSWGNRGMKDLNSGQNVIAYIASKLGPNFGVF